MTPDQFKLLNEINERSIRTEERLKSIDNKLVFHIDQSKENAANINKRLDEHDKEIKGFAKWKYGVTSALIAGISSLFKG